MNSEVIRSFTENMEPAGKQIGFDPAIHMQNPRMKKKLLTDPVIGIRRAKKDEAIRINPNLTHCVYTIEQKIRYEPVFTLVIPDYVSFFKIEKPKSRELFLACKASSTN